MILHKHQLREKIFKNIQEF